MHFSIGDFQSLITLIFIHENFYDFVLREEYERPFQYYKTSILNIMITSASNPPQKTFLLKYMDSKIIRKDFKSIEKLIIANLSTTEWKSLY